MSTVVEPPVRAEPVRIEIFESPEIVLLDRMIEAVKAEQWCILNQRDHLGRNCALGMLARYGIGDGVFPGSYLGPWDGDPRPTVTRVYELLYETIPVVRWLGPPTVAMRTSSIAAYNNSLTADEVVEWFERAKLLA